MHASLTIPDLGTTTPSPVCAQAATAPIAGGPSSMGGRLPAVAPRIHPSYAVGRADHDAGQRYAPPEDQDARRAYANGWEWGRRAARITPKRDVVDCDLGPGAYPSYT